jgi:phage-related minor tail protein
MSLTKKDLKNIGSLMEEKLEPVIKDIKHVEIKVDSVEKKVNELTGFIVPAVGNILKWTDDIHRAIVGKPIKRPHGN